MREIDSAERLGIAMECIGSSKSLGVERIAGSQTVGEAAGIYFSDPYTVCRRYRGDQREWKCCYWERSGWGEVATID